MAVERDLELLDDYLANRLDEKGRSAFEQKLNTDPNLKNEYELQHQFIDGIKKARIAQLKSMMNHVPVPSVQPNATALAGKVALWSLVVIGIVGAGLYYFFNQKQENIKTPETKIEDTLEQSQPVTQPEPVKPQENAPVVSGAPSSSEQKPVESPKAIKKQKATESLNTKDPQIDVFDPSEETHETQPPKQGNEAIIPRLNNIPSFEVSVDSENKKYNFHYQFKEGKLLLYGPFEKNLYEIMEFFSEDKRTIFLFYKDDYYLLKDGNEKLTPLHAIEDASLIKKLREYRN